MWEKKECGKRMFDSKRDAVTRLNELQHGKRRIGKLPTRAYECNICGKWHITSHPLMGDKSLRPIDESKNVSVSEDLIRDRIAELEKKIIR